MTQNVALSNSRLEDEAGRMRSCNLRYDLQQRQANVGAKIAKIYKNATRKKVL